MELDCSATLARLTPF